MTELESARAELRLRLGHALQHGSDGQHHHLNISGFMRELERFIEAKLDDETRKRDRARRKP